MRSDKFDLSRYRERSVREMRPDEQPREKLPNTAKGAARR